MRLRVLLLLPVLALPGRALAADQIQPPEDMVLVPAGEFLMGSDDAGADIP